MVWGFWETIWIFKKVTIGFRLANLYDALTLLQLQELSKAVFFIFSKSCLFLSDPFPKPKWPSALGSRGYGPGVQPWRVQVLWLLDRANVRALAVQRTFFEGGHRPSS